MCEHNILVIITAKSAHHIPERKDHAENQFRFVGPFRGLTTSRALASAIAFHDLGWFRGRGSGFFIGLCFRIRPMFLVDAFGWSKRDWLDR